MVAVRTRNRLVAGGGVDGSVGAVSYRFSGEGRFDRGEGEARVSVTLSTGL